MPLLIVLILSLCIRLFSSTAIYSGDLNNHIGWGESNLKYSFQGAYDREYAGIMQPTYPPVELFAFTTSTGLYKLSNSLVINANRNIPAFPSGLVWAFEDQDVLPAFNKVIAILADLGIVVILYCFVRRLFPKKPKTAIVVAAMYGLNPAVWYLSSLWGQVESVPLFWILLSFYCILRKKSSLAALAFAGAILSKQTSIIFGPIYLLVFLRHFNIRQLLKTAIYQYVLFYLSYLPFAPNLNPFWAIQVYINRIQTGSGSNWITDHAFNAWIWYSHLQKIPDYTKVVAGITASTIGIVGFFTILSTPYVVYIKSKFSWYRTFLISACTPLVAFLVLTKMHERYSAPVIPFLALCAAFDRRLWILYVVVSIAHLANMYHEWYFPRIAGLDTFIASWTAIQICAVMFIATALVIFMRSLRKNI